MALKIGIVGLPNAGKSTLFNALLKKQAALAANYPFATIEPNIGIVPVPDARLAGLVELVEKETGVKPPTVPATVEFVDIAGLVAGASQGQGLGNKFLSHIREVDVICHVVRYFSDPDVIHVAGEVDPKRDQEIIETELVLADLQTVEKQSEPRGVKDRDVQARWSLIVKLKESLNEGKLAKDILLDPDDQLLVRDLQLLTMKPVIFAYNVSEDRVADMSQESKGDVVIVSAKIEQDVAGLSAEEATEYLSALGLTSSGLERLIKTAYAKLGLISFLTAGEKEVRAWTIYAGTKAPQAAGTIHTDFEKKFIKAEVISYDDFQVAGTRAKARELGKLRLEGKEYVMQDGDVVEYKIGA